MDLVSPDEVPTLFPNSDSSSETYSDNHTDSSAETYTAAFFTFFTYIIPVSDPDPDIPDKNVTAADKEMAAEANNATDVTINNKEVLDKDSENTEREELLNEIVNVHEGRLFWDFCYILTGLLLLMIGLILYEIYMCRKMANGGQWNGVKPLINKGFNSTVLTVGDEKTKDEQKITQ